MTEELIKQQLDAFYGWLEKTVDLELATASMINDNLTEATRHISAAHAYHEAKTLFSDVRDHIEKLMRGKQ